MSEGGDDGQSIATYHQRRMKSCWEVLQAAFSKYTVGWFLPLYRPDWSTMNVAYIKHVINKFVCLFIT